MILSSLVLAALLAVPQTEAGADDPTPVVRRLAAAALLAAQEYQLGVEGGRIVAQPEVDEAVLFLEEARRSAGLLPPAIGQRTSTALDEALRMVRATGSPDSVSALVTSVTNRLSQELGVDLAEVPALAPSLATGARVYQANCASCHGTLGRADGAQATGLDPPPADLTDIAALGDRSPLDFYRRVTLGVAGTAMPAYETRLSAEDRWSVALYASVLRLPPPSGDVPLGLRSFPTSGRMSDSQVLEALGLDPMATTPEGLSRVAAVRSVQPPPGTSEQAVAVLQGVRAHIDSALRLAERGEVGPAQTAALDAYLAFEGVERSLRVRAPALAGDLEANFATFRSRLAGATAGERNAIHRELMVGLERAERTLGGGLSWANLFLQSFVIMLREGLEAILIIGALVAVLLKTGASERRRDVHIGVGAALVASVLTAVALETVFQLSAAHQEMLEGFTMLAAMAVLFYVSYWLLSKLEVAKWNRFVRGKVQEALVGGSALALPSVAFLAVYREGFETVLFYKALVVSADAAVSALVPIAAGFLLGALLLVVVYIAINRYGIRIPLKPFFAVTSAFLLYMAFVFAGKGIAELQDAGLFDATVVGWAPRFPALGVYPTLETLGLQALLVTLVVGALVWTFGVEPRRSKRAPRPPKSVPAPASAVSLDPTDLLRSLDRMEADLAELRAEVARIKQRVVETSGLPAAS